MLFTYRYCYLEDICNKHIDKSSPLPFWDSFGKNSALEDVSDLEALRIPHFYRSFYVYKYATGMSAAVALSNGVIEGNKNGNYTNRDNYLKFLKSGGSRTPIENLKVAGVDMTKPEVVKSALKLFAKEVEELKKLN